MRVLMLFFVVLITCGCQEKIDNQAIAFICDTKNSLTFQILPSASASPPSLIFNKDQLVFCGREGNLLVYRQDNCSNNNAVIRFDWVLKELQLNEGLRLFSMRCTQPPQQQ